MRYAIVIEQGESSYGAYVPDVEGCVAAGDTENDAATTSSHQSPGARLATMASVRVLRPVTPV